MMERGERHRPKLGMAVAAVSALALSSFAAGYLVRARIPNPVLAEAALEGRKDAHLSETCTPMNTLAERTRNLVLNSLSPKDRIAAALVRRYACVNERRRILAEYGGIVGDVDSGHTLG